MQENEPKERRGRFTPPQNATKLQKMLQIFFGLLYRIIPPVSIAQNCRKLCNPHTKFAHSRYRASAWRETESTMPISPSSIIKLVPPEEKKRQADAGVGDGVGNNGNVQHRLQHHLHHKANGQQRTEFIPRAHCDGHAAQKAAAGTAPPSEPRPQSQVLHTESKR